MMEKIDLDLMKDRISERIGREVEKNALGNILEEMDLDSIREKHGKRVESRVWEGEEINGVDVMNHPNNLLRRKIRRMLGEEGGHAYRVDVDGETIIFQWHKPHVEGFQPMDEREVEKHRKEHEKSVIDRMVSREIHQKVLEEVE